VAHANVRKRLELEQAKLEPAKRGGLPSITFGEEDPNAKARMNFHLDGLEIHLVHYGPAHTDGDVLVGVPATLVLHMGDVFFNGRTPYIDVAAGGSLEGMIANVEKVLSWLPDGAKIIPGHGPVGTKQDMARFGQFLRAVEAHVKANPGKSGAELDKSFDHKAFADFTDLPPFLPWPAFFELAAGRVPEKK
jgi:glyoxylase-like metal-dependent hydrolase (beta-lactamase superfamily II)